MNKKLILNRLDISVIKKKEISKLIFLQRLIGNPKMFLYTIICFFLRKIKIFKKIRINTFWNRKMMVVLPEVVSADILRFGFIEENVARSIIKYIFKNDVVIDVGAHFGFFTLLMSDIVGPNGQVHSFEPIPSTSQILKKNTESLNNVQVNNQAIWKLNEKIFLNDYGLEASAFNSFREPRGYQFLNKKLINKVEVDAINLDEYVKAKNLNPKFIKIDAESSEYEVLLGMNYILKKIKPIICLEIGDLGVVGAKKSRDIIMYILNYGYEVFEFNNGKFIDHKLQEIYDYGNLIFKYPIK